MTAATSLPRRIAAAIAIAVLSAGPLAACSSDNVDCNLNACTVSFDRGVDAEASVLGVDVKLVGVENGTVKIDIGGKEVSVPVDGETQAEGFDIKVEEVTQDKVVVRIQTSS